MGNVDMAGRGKGVVWALSMCLLTVGSTPLKQRWTLLPRAVDRGEDL